VCFLHLPVVILQDDGVGALQYTRCAGRERRGILAQAGASTWSKRNGVDIDEAVKKAKECLDLLNIPYVLVSELIEDFTVQETSKNAPREGLYVSDIENKNVEFENGLFGTIGMESLFGSARQKLDIEEIISCLTDKPKKRFNLPVTAIETDIKANLTLFDPDKEYVFEKDTILSKSKNSAFLGKSLKGKIYGIFSNNKLVLN